MGAPVPADMDWDAIMVKPRFFSEAHAEKSLVILTEPDGEEYPFFAEVKLRAVLSIMINDDNCGGIIINPESDKQVFVMKGVFLNAMSAALSLLNDRDEEQAKNNEKEVTIRRPINKESFDRVSDKIRSFQDDPEDYLILNLEEDADDMLFIQAVRCGDKCHVELAFDMSDF